MESEPAAGKAGDGDGPEFSVTSGLVTASASRRRTAAVVLLAAAGAGLVLVSTAKYGAGISPDSAVYLDVARNLVSGKGFVSHTGEPLVWWPPLYPMLLGLVGFAAGLDPATLARYINAALLALVIYLSGRLFRTAFRQNIAYGLLGLGAVLSSVPLSLVYSSAWSECLFIPLVLVYLLCAHHYWFGRDVRSLAVMAISAALACLTRYVGVALVLSGVVTVVLDTKRSYGNRLARALLFVLPLLVLLGSWGLRNDRLTGTFFGDRGGIHNTIASSLTSGVEATLSWYVPVDLVVTSARSLILGVVVLAGSAVAVSMFLLSPAARARLRSSSSAVLLNHLPAVLFLATYAVVLVLAATRDAVVDTRTLSPVYVPLSFILLELAHGLFGPIRHFTAATAKRIPSLLLALWLCFPFASVVRATIGRVRNGAGGLNSSKWRESETVAQAKQMASIKDKVHIYSNGPDALWELARVNARELPTRSRVNLSDLRGRWPPDSVSVLVWFDNYGWRDYVLSVEELKKVADIEEIAHLNDGSIYRVTLRDTAAATIQ